MSTTFVGILTLYLIFCQVLILRIKNIFQDGCRTELPSRPSRGKTVCPRVRTGMLSRRVLFHPGTAEASEELRRYAFLWRILHRAEPGQILNIFKSKIRHNSNVILYLKFGTTLV